MLKKITIILMVLLIVLNPVCVHAEGLPGTIKVQGGSIGSGGVDGNSSILKGAGLTVVMATLANLGISIKVAQDDYERGVGAFSYLETKFNEWENQSSQGWSTYEALNETRVGQNGELYVSENGGSVIQKFLNWLKANDEISEMPTNSGSAGQYGTFYGTRWNNTANHYFTTSIDCNYAIWRYSAGGATFIFTFNNADYTFQAYRNGSTYQPATRQVNNWYWFGADDRQYECQNINGLLDISNLGYYGISGIYNFLQQLQESEGSDVTIQNTGFYGETADIPQLVDESGNGKILTVQPGLIGQVQEAYTGSNDTTIGIQDYLDGLRDLLNQKALPDEAESTDVVIQGEDDITGVREDVAELDRNVELDDDITLPEDEESESWDNIISYPAITDPDVPADPTVAIPAMSLDLRSYFPFCIPFDIYNLLAKLNADPVTPVVNIDWGNILGVVGIDYVMTIDLHDYDGLASLLRTMELFGFVIGLGVATRSMYLRG